MDIARKYSTPRPRDRILPNSQFHLLAKRLITCRRRPYTSVGTGVLPMTSTLQYPRRRPPLNPGGIRSRSVEPCRFATPNYQAICGSRPSRVSRIAGPRRVMDSLLACTAAERVTVSMSVLLCKATEINWKNKYIGYDFDAVPRHHPSTSVTRVSRPSSPDP